MTLKKKAFEEVIEKGGKVKADVIQDKEAEWTNFTLRIKKSMLEEIETVLKSEDGITKTGFILQSIRKMLREME